MTTYDLTGFARSNEPNASSWLYTALKHLSAFFYVMVFTLEAWLQTNKVSDNLANTVNESNSQKESKYWLPFIE